MKAFPELPFFSGSLSEDVTTIRLEKLDSPVNGGVAWLDIASQLIRGFYTDRKHLCNVELQLQEVNDCRIGILGCLTPNDEDRGENHDGDEINHENGRENELTGDGDNEDNYIEILSGGESCLV